MSRRALLIIVTAVAVVIAAVPIILTLALGWYHTRFLEDVLGKGAGIYLLLVLVYVVWLPATVFCLVFVYDRLGLHYLPGESKPKRPERREELRRRATAQTVAAEESAQLAAQRAARERERSRAQPPPADDGSDAGDGHRRPKAG